jgi:SAM-dependent methyltransferase
MAKLNLGCGYDKKKGFINVDIAHEVDPDICINIEGGLPFKDNTFSYIYSSHCLEHIQPHKWQYVLKEIMRVAKNGAILELLLPFDNTKKRTNIAHFRTFSYWSFTQFYVNSDRPYYSDWKLKPIKVDSFNPFFLLFPILKKEIYYKFKVVKW